MQACCLFSVFVIGLGVGCNDRFGGMGGGDDAAALVFVRVVSDVGQTQRCAVLAALDESLFLFSRHVGKVEGSGEDGEGVAGQIRHRGGQECRDGGGAAHPS